MASLILLALAGAFQSATVPGNDGWTLSATPGACTALRQRQGGVSLSIAYHAVRGEVSLFLMDASLTTIENDRSYDIVIRFPRSGGEIRAGAIGIRVATRDDLNRGLTFLQVGRDFIDKFASYGAFELRLGQERIGRYTLAGAGDAMARLVGCVEQGPPPGTAVINLNSYFSSDDYPRAALRNREEGTVGFRLVIGRNGQVSDCVITSSSGSAILDETTCRILRERARYQPALDADGNAATGTDQGRITWHLPR